MLRKEKKNRIPIKTRKGRKRVKTKKIRTIRAVNRKESQV